MEVRDGAEEGDDHVVQQVRRECTLLPPQLLDQLFEVDVEHFVEFEACARAAFEFRRVVNS